MQASSSGPGPIKQKQGKSKWVKHNLPSTNSPVLVEEKELRNISKEPDILKKSAAVKHDLLSTNNLELMEGKETGLAKEKQKKSKRAKHSLSSITCSELVQEKDQRNVLKENEPVEEKLRKSKSTKRSLPSINSSEPIEEEDQSNIVKETNPIVEKQRRRKRAKHSLSSINCLEPVEEKDKSNVLNGSDPGREKQKKRSMGAKCSLPCGNGFKPVVEKDLNNILQEPCEIHDAKESPSLESVNENLKTALETENTSENITVKKKRMKKKCSAPENHDAIQKSLEDGCLYPCEVLDAKESPSLESVNESLKTALETENTSENITVKKKRMKKKRSAPGNHDAIQKSLEEEPCEVLDAKESPSLESVNESLKTVLETENTSENITVKKKRMKKKRCAPENHDAIQKSWEEEPCEVHDAKESPSLESVNENLKTSFKTENTSENITVKKKRMKKKHSAPENHDAIQKSLEEETDSSRKANHEESVGSIVTSLVEMKHNASLEKIDTDSMEDDVPSEMNSLNVKMITSSFRARENNQMEMKKYPPSENDREFIKDDDPTTSLQAVQNSPMGSASVSCLNKVNASVENVNKKKPEWAVHEDRACKDMSTSDLLRNAMTRVQIEVDQRDVSKRGESEASLTDCNKEACTLPPGCVVEDVTSLDMGGLSTSLQVVHNGFVEISVAGCGDKELATTRENAISEVKSTIHEDKSVNDTTIYDVSPDYLLPNGDALSNLQIAVPGCCIFVEANLESCSIDCQKEAKKNIENGAKKQDTLLEVSTPPKRAHVNCNRRKLLILDLNGLLVDIVNFQFIWRKPDTKVGGKSVYKRPFCDDFLKFCFESFDVGIWSSRVSKNLQAMVNFLMGDDKDKLLFCWDQSKCTFTGYNTIENSEKPLLLKELQKIWDKEEPNLPWEKGEYTPSNTLLLDDSPYKALRNPPYTAIFPMPYRSKDENDTSLGPGGDLRVYLEGLAKSDDVLRYVQEHPFGQRAITSANPSWPFYHKVVGVENSSAPALSSQGC